MKLKIILFILLALTISNKAQDDDGLLLGKTKKEITAAFYDVSDPEGINIEVNLWGFVKYPGRYIVPVKTTLMDLLSYAGGPLEDSDLNEIRIIRNPTNTNEKPTLIKLDYNDLLWKDKVLKVNKNNPEIYSGDLVVVMEEKKYFFREDVSFILAVTTSLFTIATFVLTLIYK